MTGRNRYIYRHVASLAEWSKAPDSSFELKFELWFEPHSWYLFKQLVFSLEYLLFRCCIVQIMELTRGDMTRSIGGGSVTIVAMDDYMLIIHFLL